MISATDLTIETIAAGVGYDSARNFYREALLYEWIEEYEPALFRHIQRLAAEGRWNIIGGWYLQPDCTMLSGESFVRPIRDKGDFIWRGFDGSEVMAYRAFGGYGTLKGQAVKELEKIIGEHADRENTLIL